MEGKGEEGGEGGGANGAMEGGGTMEGGREMEGGGPVRLTHLGSLLPLSILVC